mmetsp:Transcript_11713/g.22409  ORF Transcript_11713/g.22409 Transcript_11713/m.22409 type:complete len:106 (-) Transcript_11713:407-724(-)
MEARRRSTPTDAAGDIRIVNDGNSGTQLIMIIDGMRVLVDTLHGFGFLHLKHVLRDLKLLALHFEQVQSPDRTEPLDHFHTSCCGERPRLWPLPPPAATFTRTAT